MKTTWVSGVRILYCPAFLGTYCRNISITTGGGGVNAIFSDYLRLQSFVISYIATAGGLVYKYWQNVLASAVTRSGRDTPYPLLVAATPLLSARDLLVI